MSKNNEQIVGKSKRQLRVIDHVLYSETGQALKKLSCPLDIEQLSVDGLNTALPSCNQCDRLIINCDHQSVESLTKILTDEPDSCLMINPFNPMFKIERK